MSQSRSNVTEVVRFDNTELELIRGEYWFVEADRVSWYWYYVPNTKAPKMSLTVQLHGVFGDPSNCCHWPSIVPVADKLGMIVAGIYGYDRHGWYGARGPGMTEDTMATGCTWIGDVSEADVMNVIGILRKEYPIDAKKIYVMGQSMGGAGTVHMASKYPHVFAGMCACCPNVWCLSQADRLESIVKSLKEVPSFVVMGVYDELIKLTEVREMVKAMADMEVTYRYLELDGSGHADVLADESLWETTLSWLSSQTKANDAPEILRPSVLRHPEAYFEKKPEKDEGDATLASWLTWAMWRIVVPVSRQIAEGRAKDEQWKEPFAVKDAVEAKEKKEGGKLWV